MDYIDGVECTSRGSIDAVLAPPTASRQYERRNPPIEYNGEIAGDAMRALTEALSTHSQATLSAVGALQEHEASYTQLAMIGYSSEEIMSVVKTCYDRGIPLQDMVDSIRQCQQAASIGSILDDPEPIYSSSIYNIPTAWADKVARVAFEKPMFRLKDYAHVNKVAMHVSTYDELKLFSEFLYANGDPWLVEYSLRALLSVGEDMWEQLGSNLCLSFNTHHFYSIDDYKDRGFQILEFSDFDWSLYAYLVEPAESRPKPMTLEELDKLLEEERRADEI